MSEFANILPLRKNEESTNIKEEFIDTNRFYSNSNTLSPSSPFREIHDTSPLHQKTIRINNLNNSQNSSITIVTSNNTEKEELNSSTSTINICINNHFNNSIVSKKEKQYPIGSNSNTCTIPSLSSSIEDDEVDGLFMNSKFSNGQDVLVQRKDGKFYLGTITAMSATQCLVKFDDLSLYWANYDEVSRLNTSFAQHSVSMCVLCKTTEGVIEICQKCGRGYHNKCSQLDCPK